MASLLSHSEAAQVVAELHRIVHKLTAGNRKADHDAIGHAISDLQQLTKVLGMQVDQRQAAPENRAESKPDAEQPQASPPDDQGQVPAAQSEPNPPVA